MKKIRLNVLILVGCGYIAVVFMFTVMTFSEDMTAVTAYGVVEAPLMALIGGSLAIAKDVLSLDHKDSGGSTDRKEGS